MKSKLAAILAGPSLFALGSTPQAAPAEGGVDEIVVTARRVDESIMDVPQTVNAITSSQLKEYSILKFEDISQLVPGLDLNSDNSGFRATASVRGVSFDVSSQGTPTVETYFNEVPVEPGLLFQGSYDIGQIEVLRGPQGTLRGRSAPSGSITQQTHRPDLSEYGGYASSALTDLGGINTQGALSVPIIQDKLGIRIAALYDYTDAGGVTSANNQKDPHVRTASGRATVRFEPTDSIAAILMYQYMDKHSLDYGSIQFGPGAVGIYSLPTGTLPGVIAPPNFNGPPLSGKDFMSVQEFPREVKQPIEIWSLQTDWAFAGQKLSYVGGYSSTSLSAIGDGDASNTIIGKIGPSEGIDSFSDRKTHEIRISSEERLFGLMDYTFGGFYGRYYAHTKLNRPDTVINAGAFGSPIATGILLPYTYDSRYAHDLKNDSSSVNTERSIFTNLMFHVGDKLELSAGGRKIFSNYTKQVNAQSITGLTAVANPGAPGACALGSTYPGTCDLLLAAPTLLRSVPKTTREDNPFVYSFSVAYHFLPDLMAYVNYGTSWRAGPGPITGAPLCSAVSTSTAPDPTLCDKYNILDPEESKGVEVGLKTSLLEQRLSISVATYLQDYDGYLTFGAPTPYLTGNCTSLASPACRVTTGGFTYNADVETKGVDADVSFAFNEDLNVGIAASWSKGNFKDTAVPCRDQLGANGAAGFDGVPDSGALMSPAQWVAAGGPYGPSVCVGNNSSTTSPPWNANLRGEYSHEIFEGGRGFVRMLFNYYPENTNRQVSNASFIPDSYQLLSLFLGVRSSDGAWEVSVSGKNIFDDDTVLSQGLTDGALITPQQGRLFGPTTSSGTASSGYRTISYVQRQEFSLNLRYSFGSD